MERQTDYDGHIDNQTVANEFLQTGYFFKNCTYKQSDLLTFCIDNSSGFGFANRGATKKTRAIADKESSKSGKNANKYSKVQNKHARPSKPARIALHSGPYTLPVSYPRLLLLCMCAEKCRFQKDPGRRATSCLLQLHLDHH